LVIGSHKKYATEPSAFVQQLVAKFARRLLLLFLYDVIDI